MFFNSILCGNKSTILYPNVYHDMSTSASYVATYDGVNWLAGTFAGSSPGFYLRGKDGLWMRCTSTGVLSKSVNFINWTSVTSPISGVVTLAFNGTHFLIYKTSARNVAISSDAVNWTTSLLPSTAAWTIPFWNGSHWLTVASSTNQSAMSTDGINWVAGTLPATQVWYTPAWNGSYWLVIGNSDVSNVGAISSDGINWTAINTGGCDYPVLWTGTSWFSQLYPAYPKATIRSSDGINWFLTATSWDDAAYDFFMNMYGGNIYTDVGLSADGAGVNQFSISTDAGATWSTPVVLPTGYVWRSSVYTNNMFFKLGVPSSGSYVLAYSSDGINWTITSVPITAESANGSVFYYNGVYNLPNGATNQLATSTDLINWSFITLPITPSGVWKGMKLVPHG